LHHAAARRLPWIFIMLEARTVASAAGGPRPKTAKATAESPPR